MKARYGLIIGMLSLLIALTGCRQLMDIKVSGNVNEGVFFTLCEYGTSDILVDEVVVEIRVSIVEDDLPRTIWLLEGRAALTNIKYGKEYNGFITRHMAGKLSEGNVYQINIYIVGDGGTIEGGKRFILEKDGSVRESG